MLFSIWVFVFIFNFCPWTWNLICFDFLALTSMLIKLLIFSFCNTLFATSSKLSYFFHLLNSVIWVIWSRIWLKFNYHLCLTWGFHVIIIGSSKYWITLSAWIQSFAWYWSLLPTLTYRFDVVWFTQMCAFTVGGTYCRHIYTKTCWVLKEINYYHSIGLLICLF